MAKAYFPRKGAWAVDEGGNVGVLFEGVTPEGNPQMEFHKVDAVTGETVTIVPRDWAGLQIAPAASLPASRVGHLSEEQLAALGYV